MNIQGDMVIDVNNENKKNLVIGMVGFIGSGKDTAADYLVNHHGFRRESFAGALKDAVSVVFGWDRILLEGKTVAARQWREQIDPWWAERLGIPNLTPRWVLQCWGTDVLRKHFHHEIWVASVENKLQKATDNIVISDVRFPNEIAAIRRAGGKIVRIKRGPDPDWVPFATKLNQGPTHPEYYTAKNYIEAAKIHASEYSWIGADIDHKIDNDQTIEDLFQQIRGLLPVELPTHMKIILDLI